MKKKEILQEIGWILLFCLGAVYLPLSLFNFAPGDVPGIAWPSAPHVNNPMGRFGSFLAEQLLWAFGKSSAYLLSFGVAAWSALRFLKIQVDALWLRVVGTAVLALSLMALEPLLDWGWLSNPVPPFHGGVLGTALAGFSREFFGAASIPLAMLMALLSAALATDFLFYPYLMQGIEKLQALRAGKRSAPPEASAAGSPRARAPFAPVPAQALPETNQAPVPVSPLFAPPASQPPRPAGEDEDMDERPAETIASERKKPAARPAALKDEEPEPLFPASATGTEFKIPPIDYVEPSPPPADQSSDEVVQERAATLQQALAQYGLQAQVVAVERGPVITMYELMLAPGVKVHKIMALSDDIAMVLKATSIRIVAPLPGKSTVGIEMPNANRSIVRMRELVAQCGKEQIPICLGRDATGALLVADLAKMPHLLIAGATGSGKTVCLNTAIVSILMTRRPDEVKMVLIDPKMVELAAYRDLPHLACPVVTDMKKSAHVLNWAVQEMEGRYDLLARAGVRHIETYNKLSADEIRSRLAADDPQAIFPLKLPYLVVIVDELADLMMVAAGEIETSITRLAQKSRSVGIHIILATQRPSVDVITGLIKSNLPSRISFQVASKVDSRTILDKNGAEKLLGSGDLLFQAPGAMKLIRAQGTYISDEEIQKITQYWKDQGAPQYEADLMRIQKLEPEALEDKDELYDEALGIVLTSQRGSVSLLQRHFGIGYTRAARLIDSMAREGIVGQYKGSQAREVLMTMEQWDARNAKAPSEEATQS